MSCIAYTGANYYVPLLCVHLVSHLSQSRFSDSQVREILPESIFIGLRRIYDDDQISLRIVELQEMCDDLPNKQVHNVGWLSFRIRMQA